MTYHCGFDLNTGKTQAGIKIAGRNINNLRYADDTTLMAESEEQLKSLLMKVKEESEKVQHSENEDHGIISWEIDGETVETVSDFIFRGSKITADGDCSHELKDAYSLEGKLWLVGMQTSTATMENSVEIP